MALIIIKLLRSGGGYYDVNSVPATTRWQYSSPAEPLVYPDSQGKLRELDSGLTLVLALHEQTWQSTVSIPCPDLEAV
eukprot:g81868.t1